MIYVSFDTQAGQEGRLAIEWMTAVEGLTNGKELNTGKHAPHGKP